MSKVMVVEQYSQGDIIKCWMPTKDTTLGNMLTLCILRMALKNDMEVIKGNWLYMQEADIVIRDNMITQKNPQGAASIETDVWFWYGEAAITKAFEKISKKVSKQTHQYIYRKLLPVIYKGDTLTILTKDQKIIDRIMGDMNMVYSIYGDGEDFEHLLNMTGAFILNIIEDVYNAEKKFIRNPFKPRIVEGDLIASIVAFDYVLEDEEGLN